MANEPELKHLHRSIEVEEAEVALYRARLGERLSEVPERGRFRLLWAVAPLAVAAALMLFLNLGSAALPQLRLADLELVLERYPGQVQRQAKTLQDGDGLDAWNANMVQCLSLPPEQGVFYAAKGLGLDSRAEFRLFYLEYLLDYADERTFNLAQLEGLMERETDPDCLKLYRWMLRIS